MNVLVVIIPLPMTLQRMDSCPTSLNQLAEIPPGATAQTVTFAARREDRTAIYSHEQEMPELDAAQLAAFQSNPAAWAYFSARPPSYRKAAIWWVVSAKREETRERRLRTLIEDSAQERLLGHLRRGKPAPAAESG